LLPSDSSELGSSTVSPDQPNQPDIYPVVRKSGLV
jgi:hypothetical protein